MSDAAIAAAPAARPPAKKGFVFRSAKVKEAPEEMKQATPPPAPLVASLKPSAVTTGMKARVGEGDKVTAVRGMFGATAAKKSNAKPAAKPMFATAAAPKPKAATAAPKPAATLKPTPTSVEQPPLKTEEVEDAAAAAAAKPAAEPEPQPSTGFVADELEAEAEKAEAEAANAQATTFDDDLAQMAELIQAEESTDLYSSPIPDAYVPQTRRGFADFIKSTYRTFELPAGPIPSDQKYYPYQRFVRDYMRQEAPYRGVLVYHGLGSGKTCTSIATAEALFAASHKKIIVMANYSLKKNFFNEISKCGFRHFQLQNYWTPLDVANPTTALFANQVLGLSAAYLKRAKHIWVPDFRKGPAEANYRDLPDEDRQEIRQQLLSILEWHPEKNPTGRIRFLAYNGVSAKKLLKMACDPAEEKFFDNAVIVVDEIHNLIRNIQGKIEPYLTDRPVKGGRRKRVIPIETVRPYPRWRPTVCDENTKLYNRGYLFYRLLTDARNSKIVGLSGTPLINFPEELGILANVLHGYITLCEGVVGQVGSQVIRALEEVAHKHPFIDYVKAKQDPTGGGTLVTFTLMPPGIRKIANDVGVERIPPEEEVPRLEDVVASVKEAFSAAKFPFRGDLKVTAEALLPPFGEGFKEAFVSEAAAAAGSTANVLKNQIVLITRLTGLVSYYKGSQLELMPKVLKDEVVRVPFSLYSQKAYSVRRAQEVESEMEKKGEKTGGAVEKIWAQIYQLGDSASANNYKMGSRQACNFAFPPEVVRPAPRREEAVTEAAEGEAADGDLGPAAADGIAEPKEAEAAGAELLSAELMTFEGVSAEAEAADAAEAAEAAREEAEILAETGLVAAGPEGTALLSGGGWGEEVLESEEDDSSSDEDDEEGEEEEEEEENSSFLLDTLVALEGGGKKKTAAAAAAEPSAAAAAAAASEPSAAEPIRFYHGLENEYKDFSTYAETPFIIEGQPYPTAEHYFQSASFEGSAPDAQVAIRAMKSAPRAKLYGKKEEAKRRPDFKQVRYEMMKTAQKGKFEQNERLRALLLSTGDRELIDASPKDKYFGVGEEGDGSNNLGKILMELRTEFQATAAAAERAKEMAAAFAAPKKAKAPAKIKPKAKPAAAEAAAVAAAAAVATPSQEDCQVGRKPGEDYKAACARAKHCLGTIAKKHLVMGGEDGLEIYSPKYAAILKRVTDTPGSSLVYSQFLDMEGIGIFRVAMEVNGYAPIEIVPLGGQFAFSKRTEESFRLGPGKQPRFITFSGGEDPKVRSLALDLFNARFSELTEPMVRVLKDAGYTENKVGEICRVFCITAAGAEGLSLRNVRAVHIMEPYWNEVRLRQVKGRAIRIGSHLDLPEDQRNVAIYTYISTFPEQSQGAKAGEYRVDETLLIHDSIDGKEAVAAGLPLKPGLRTYTLTTDEMIYVISERKRRVVESLELALKSAAVDCELNYKQNKEGDSFRCLTLKGKVGDFVYTPVLADDIQAAAGLRISTGIPAAAAAAAAAPAAAAPAAPAAAAAPAAPQQAPLEPGEFHKLFKKVLYIMKPTKDGETITGFRMLDPITRKIRGYAAAKEGKPAPPVDFLEDVD